MEKRIDKYGNIRWFLNSKLHRDNDLPAVEIKKFGIKHWYQNGVQHRDGDKPASITETGHREWIRNGKYHRDGDLPAIEDINGDREWYKYGKLHRIGVLPAIEHANGDREWYKYGRSYTLEQLITYYFRLSRFGRYTLGEFRMHRLKKVKWIHGELLCKPPKGNFLGGLDYHKMVCYFNKL